MTPEKQQRKITITTRTFLRVKRPRHLDPLATLCLDLSSQQQQQQTQGKNKRHRKSGPENDKTVEDLSQLMHQSTYVSAMQQHNQASKNDTPPKPPSSSPPSTLVWKRVSDASKSSNATSASTHHLNSNNHSNKRIRYVDARLDTDNENDANGVITPKRRRLALTLLQPECSSSSSTSTPPTHNLSLAGSSSSVADKKKKKSLSSPTKQNAILDPLSRLVDDSLQSVIAGTKQICEHLDFITTDSRLEDMTQQQSQSKKWLCWSTKRMKHGGGTILHAAALYNDLSSTTRILSMAASFSPTAQPKRNNSSSSSSSTILEVLLKEKDTDGRTPYKIAKIIGHDRIIQALDAYGAMEYEKEELEKQKKEEEEGDFVYDVFCLQEEEEIMGGDKQQDQHPQTTTNNTNYATTESTCTDMATTKMAISTTNPKVVNVPEVVELRGGIGYWDEHGELVLEAVGDEYDMDDDNDSTLEDDDVDSNCEDHDGNDYPDEDELFDEDDWAEGIIRNDDDSSNDDGDANEYRHRPVYMNGGDSNLAIRNITNVMGGGTGFGGTAATHGDDDEDDNDYYNNIDTEYDLYDNDGQQGNRMYAYDPEFDHGDDGYNSYVE